MLCSHCGRCCEKTEMLLSRADVKRLETLGYSRKEFFVLISRVFLDCETAKDAVASMVKQNVAAKFSARA